MKRDLTVYCFKGYYESDRDFIQTRFVIADTEAEATKKIERYSKEKVKQGFDRFIWFDNPTVEIEYVIN